MALRTEASVVEASMLEASMLEASMTLMSEASMVEAIILSVQFYSVFLQMGFTEVSSTWLLISMSACLGGAQEQDTAPLMLQACPCQLRHIIEANT